ncbi:hypothetical protein CSUNSWCD_1098 [Campylobacter showae CSUNSWCD]|uniref:Uncharacterized protein n=1 Tax=Campylobacter showae CSUNSWCD TaxID=1244083 RepID=M5INC8_9BACT|nr:hypothetical protein CSUNSWCD_1098 [Campylobacter showae CSUNSWCD]
MLGAFAYLAAMHRLFLVGYLGRQIYAQNEPAYYALNFTFTILKR